MRPVRGDPPGGLATILLTYWNLDAVGGDAATTRKRERLAPCTAPGEYLAMDEGRGDGWDNEVPTEVRTICDHMGRGYLTDLFRLEAQTDFVAKIEGRPIIRASIVGPGEVWSLNNLFVDDHVPTARTMRGVVIGYLLRRPTHVSFRGLGLGAAMLRLVVEEARYQGAKRLVGDAVPERPCDTARLIEFYRRGGFRIEPPRRGEGPDAVARVVMELGGT